MVEYYSADDFEGALCVVMTTTDYSNPQIVRQYWPTVYTTRDFLFHLFDDEARDSANWPALFKRITVVRSMPGEYFIGTKPGQCWQGGRHCSLVDGAHTVSVKTELIDAPPPKTRCPVYWSSGYWLKRMARGNERIDPVSLLK